MTTDETSTAKQRFFDEHLPRLKPIGEHEVAKTQPLQRQPKLHSSSLFPPIIHSAAPASIATSSSTESPSSSITYNSTVREAANRFMSRQSVSLISAESSPQHAASVRPKRPSLYSYVQPKVNTGLPRTESMALPENDTYRLGPIRPLNWRTLKHELEQDTQIRVQAKRIQFNSGITYATQLKSLANLVRVKVKSYVSSVMGFGEERYKIVVHLTVFETKAGGLHVASRCLWNTLTDNSVTIKMQGVDCDILIVVFLCYTDLGPVSS